jgi:hypothetical protein
MPVQINEVIIRTVVDNQPSSSSQGENAGVSSGNSTSSQENILEQLLEIIQESKER